MFLSVIPIDAATAQDRELLRQQERERVLREQLEGETDVRLERPADAATDRLPTAEYPCFPIMSVRLVGDDALDFRWALAASDPEADPATGRCLGTAGVDTVMRRIQNAIVARGFVTTRVVAAPQDLTVGRLDLTVVPGRIRAIRFAPGTDARATSWNAVPAKPGDLLNLRDIEQALENFKRVPTVEADIQIAPADGAQADAGESDLVIVWQQRRPVRVSVTLDDSGSRSTGKLQAGATLSLDDALRWNDLFYVSVGHGAFNGSDKGTRSYTAHYSAPLHYWLLSATGGASDYFQSVAGSFQSYVYSGTSRNAELKASRLLFRNARIKTGAFGRGWYRDSANFIDDTEIEVQRRRTAGWEVGFTHRHFLGTATLDASAAYRRGTGAFAALVAPEEAFGEGTARSALVTADAQLAVPFRLGTHGLRYSGSWRAQWNRTALVSQDRFAIGGRYSVRGFDGESSLVGERGWTVRNDLGLSLGGGQELYLGADAGQVGGPSTRWQVGNALVGGVIGLRGSARGATWDVFVGTPIDKPEGFRTAYTTTGFSLSWSL